ncbi:uroporphyrinogen-III C-methyltransferase [Cellulomonas sp. HZM]|uniref:uroporphyrinogen-III C-methyltransferase n=1 Tax=Cellulomonas sp. HZM TaxID=1454010 RepID=UPI0035101269
MLLGLELTGRAVLVAGGGPVAARRARALQDEGARVVVVAPDVCETLRDMALAGEVEHRARDVVADDLDGTWLAVTATGDASADRDVVRWAAERRVFCVDVGGTDRPAAGTARTPATAAVGDLLLGVVSTAAADPRRSAAVRDALVQHLCEGGVDLRRRRPPTPGRGRVVLVGGGPGDPGLLTVAGRRALAEADVVVTDRLGPVSVLDELPSDVEVIDVGKVPGHHRLTQDEINQVLVDQASLGRTVVRLKGGDPFVYGRGGEEVLACRAAGVDVAVVPGVSSALAAPAAAGIPLTHRGLVRTVHVINGHDGWDEAGLTALRTGASTVVALMAVSVLPELVSEALAAGVRPDLPVAVVENGSLASQRVTRARLDEVAAEVARVGVRPPAVVVLGEVTDPGLLVPDERSRCA